MSARKTAFSIYRVGSAVWRIDAVEGQNIHPCCCLRFVWEDGAVGNPSLEFHGRWQTAQFVKDYRTAHWDRHVWNTHDAPPSNYAPAPAARTGPGSHPPSKDGPCQAVGLGRESQFDELDGKGILRHEGSVNQTPPVR